MRNHKDTKGKKEGRMNKSLFAALICALGVFVVPCIRHRNSEMRY